MKRIAIFFVLLLFTASLTSCNLPSTSTPIAVTGTPEVIPDITGTPTQPVVTPPSETTPSPEPFAITLDLLKNFTYIVESPETQVTLTDGVFSSQGINSRLIEPAAFGDLNGDGIPDAAVVLATNLGGSGTFYDLIAVLNQNGSPAQANFVPFGDRQLVNDLRIEGGRVVLDYITQGLTDPSCCPNEHRLRSYLLDNGALLLASEQVLESATSQATPLPNAILIDQPGMYAFLTDPVQVRGRVSQVPADRILEYYVTDLQGTLLTNGDVPLEGEPDGAGSFAFEFSLGALPSGIIKLEIVDSAGGMLYGRSMVDLLTR